MKNTKSFLRGYDMKNCKTTDFIEHTKYEECAVQYKNIKYFFNGIIFDKSSGKYTYRIDIWDQHNNYVKTVYDQSFNTEQECIDNALIAKIFDKKSFWDVENELEWIEW